MQHSDVKGIVSGLRKRRQRLGVPQKELAARANVSQSFVSKLEAGFINPSYANVERLAGVLEEMEHTEEPAVSAYAHKKVVAVNEDDTVVRAIRVMKKRGFSQLPVFRHGFCVGTVTERRLFEALSESMNIAKKKVRDIMDEPLPVVSPSTKRSACIALLRSQPAVLVANKGSVIGIVTKSDFL
ncbi:MAG: CBS domain-containing protein [Candidatus Aenigmarchaeota archaeon]|nr:CBS domain-containing protein [Candidatus Aenigmarchaeota archaeon]